MSEPNNNQTQTDQEIKAPYAGPLRRQGDLTDASGKKGALRIQRVAAILATLSGLAACTMLALLHSRSFSAGAGPLLTWARALSWIVLLISIAQAVVAEVLVLKPLQVLIQRIRMHKPMPAHGTYELQYLAHSYNAMLEEYLRSEEELRYKAEHDALTGLYNRGAYEQLLAAHQTQGSIALLWVDVDFFKQFNDRYGHDIGDKVLKKVGQTLTHGFRVSDYICRTGGDEFAVIMVNITPKLRSVVLRRVNAVQDALRNPTDGLPQVTLSIGVAFSSQCGPNDSLYKMADKALYQVKEAGRNGCAFYEPETDNTREGGS